MRCVPALLCAALLALPSLGRAACTISTAGLAFGTYDPLSTTPRDATGSVSYNCQNVGWASAYLSRGSSPTLFNRTMTQGANALSYNVYLDTGHTQVWGDASGSYYVLVPNGKGSIPVYGRIFAQQDVSAGAYSDVLTVTFNF